MKKNYIICAIVIALISIFVLIIAINNSGEKNDDVTDSPKYNARARLLDLAGGTEAGYSAEIVDTKTDGSDMIVTVKLVHKKMGEIGKYSYVYSSNGDGTYTYEYNYPEN